MNLEVKCQKAPWSNGIEMIFFSHAKDGSTFVGKPIIMEKIEQGEFVGESSINLKNDQAQGLMDELWRCGLRPSEGTGSAGSLAATERHLKDMQKIAMGLLQEHGVK